MRRLKSFYKKTSWYPVFNTDTEFGRGRIALLLHWIPREIVGGFTQGVFYTGLLIGYDINIVNISILNTIPYLACLFSFFTPYILERFPKRRGILTATRIIYFFINIVGITLLPSIVHNERGRIVGLIAIIFVSNAINYLFDGFGPWHAYYYEPSVRNTYESAATLISCSVSAVVMVSSSAIMDAVPPQMQLTLIKTLRYVSFGVALIQVWLMQRPKEPTYLKSADKPAIIDVLRRPLQEKNFRLVCLTIFMYQIANYTPEAALNVWLLEDVKVGYLYIYVVNALIIPFLLITPRFWKWVVRKLGSCMTLMIALLIYAVAMCCYAFVDSSNYRWLMTLVRFTGHAITLGISFANSNLYYEQLPPKDQTAHVSFYNMAMNGGIFLGSTVGTMYMAVLGNKVLKLFGRHLSGVPVLLLIQAAFFLLLAIFVYLLRRRLKPTEENRTTG